MLISFFLFFFANLYLQQWLISIISQKVCQFSPVVTQGLNIVVSNIASQVPNRRKLCIKNCESRQKR